jgi:hypothetical protein
MYKLKSAPTGHWNAGSGTTNYTLLGNNVQKSADYIVDKQRELFDMPGVPHEAELQRCSEEVHPEHDAQTTEGTGH